MALVKCISALPTVLVDVHSVLTLTTVQTMNSTTMMAIFAQLIALNLVLKETLTIRLAALGKREVTSNRHAVPAMTIALTAILRIAHPVVIKAGAMAWTIAQLGSHTMQMEMHAQ